MIAPPVASARGRPALRSALLLVTLLGTAACADDPDLVARGATRVPGTAGAAYLGGRPFSLSPDGRFLLFAHEVDPAGDADPAGYALHQLAAYRLHDLSTGTAVTIAPPGARVRERVARVGLLADGGCWTQAADRAVLRTPFAAVVALEVTGGDGPHWALLARSPESLVPGCREPLPPTGDLRRGPFVVGRGRPDRLVVRHAAGSGELLFAAEADGLRDRVLLGDVALDGRGTRLALVYSPATGAFVGRAQGVLLDAGGAPARPLGGGVLKVAWAADGGVLYGYGRADGARAYAIYRWTQ